MENTLDKINFTFNVENKNTLLDDVSLIHEDIKIKSEQIKLSNKNKKILIEGDLETDEVSLNKMKFQNILILAMILRLKKLIFHLLII